MHVSQVAVRSEPDAADLPDEESPTGGPKGVGSGRRLLPWGLALAAAVIVLSLTSLLVGAGDVGPGKALRYLAGSPELRDDAHVDMVITSLRLPRTLVAVLIGLALGVAGAMLQAATRNPIADTGLLGINSGAALGVVIGITYAGAQGGFDYLLWAFAGALGASAIVLLMSASGKAAMTPLRLVLAGAALGATFRGLTAYLTLGNAATYDQYRFWILGSLSGITLDMFWRMTPVVLAGLCIAAVAVRPLSALQLGDDAARALGHRPAATRSGVAVAVTLLAAASIALAGPVAFLGLIGPYIARALTGPRMGPQLLFSGLAGACVLLIADMIARVIVKPYEAPASVLLAIVGGPILVWIVRTNRTVGVTT